MEYNTKSNQVILPFENFESNIGIGKNLYFSSKYWIS